VEAAAPPWHSIVVGKLRGVRLRAFGPCIWVPRGVYLMMRRHSRMPASGPSVGSGRQNDK
jgi:hypothetical protein